MKKTLGGDRLGSGSKMQVELHNYNRSTHDLGYLWRSTMSAGTLVPFMCQVALPGDTFDINLNCDIKTHPTIGPLFGSYKVQLDLFECPIRLYNAHLHNNAMGIGLKMSNIKLPVVELQAAVQPPVPTTMDNTQINPSCILAYLGIRGVGYNPNNVPRTRMFNGVPLLAYWDIYKNYYANKQEEKGVVIHTPMPVIVTMASDPTLNAATIPLEGTGEINTLIGSNPLVIDNTGNPIPNQILFNTSIGTLSWEQLAAAYIPNGTDIVSPIKPQYIGVRVFSYKYLSNTQLNQTEPVLQPFDLEQIDLMRYRILADSTNVPFNITAQDLPPYAYVLSRNLDGYNHMLSTQEGLGIKTYQSDLFNNWLQTEWIDGIDGITAVTAIDTSGGSFTIDTLNLSRKVYDMLNRIAISGGSYQDWIGAVYQDNKYAQCESPIYHGGLIKELVFQEVVSNAATATPDETQPLGTLAGKGILAHKHKGGSSTIKITEPSYIMGIVSITPRIDYSQGNSWDVNLQTMDDFHKPALDEIGFQELITEQLAWWDTSYDGVGAKWVTKSAGKQPAWINYMTNVNKTYGNFAIPENEMFMTLNRRYEWDWNAGLSKIVDLTTYIDPVKYNQIFAQTSLDAQNFWTQISVDITARRLMSARLMPNL